MTTPTPPSLPWYGRFEAWLEPRSTLARGLLIVVALVSLILAVQGPAVAVVAWLVYLLSP